MATPATFVSYTETGNVLNANPGTTGYSTANVAVLVGDLVIVWSGVEGSVNGLPTLSFTGGLTGTVTTHQSDSTGSYAACGIASAIVTAAGNLQGKAVYAINSSSNGNVGVWVYRNHGGVGATAKAHQAASSAPSLTFTVAANSAVAAITTDWTAQAGSRTYRQVNSANPTERGHFGNSTNWHYDAYDYADTGAGGSITLGESAPTGQTPNTLAVEVLASPAASKVPVSIGTYGNASGTSNNSFNTTGAVPAGGRLIVPVEWASDTTATTPVVYSGQLRFVRDYRTTATEGSVKYGIDYWSAYCPNGLPSGTTIHIDFLPVAPYGLNVGAMYAMGLARGQAIDTAANVFRPSATSTWTAGPITTGNANDLLLCTAFSDHATVLNSSTPLAGSFTELQDFWTGGTDWAMVNSYREVSSTGTYTPTGTWLFSPSFADFTAIVAYKADPGIEALDSSTSEYGDGTYGKGEYGMRWESDPAVTTGWTGSVARRYLHMSNSPGANQSWTPATSALRHSAITLHGATAQPTDHNAIKTASATTDVGFYVDLGYADNGTGLQTVFTSAECRIQGWLAYDMGAEFANPFGGDSVMVDLGAPGVAEGAVKRIKQKFADAITAGSSQAFDFVFLDDVNIQFNDMVNANKVPDSYASVADYSARAVVPTLRYIAQAMWNDGVKFVIPNLGDWVNLADQDTAYGVARSGFNEQSTNGVPRVARSSGQLTQMYNNIRDAASKGNRIFLMTPLIDQNDSQTALYGWAYANIVGEPGTTYHAVAGPNGWYGYDSPQLTEHGYDLGAPLEGPQISGGLYSRRFTNYTVYANVSGSSVTIPADSSTLTALTGRFDSVSVVEAGAATIPGLSSISFLSSVEKRVAATIAAVATDTAGNQVQRQGAATIAAISTVTAPSSKEARAAATIAATATVTAAGDRTATGSATIAAASTVTAPTSIEHNAAATIAAASTVTAPTSIEHYGQSSAAGVSTVTAGGFVERDAASTIAGVSTVTTSSSVIKSGVATIAGQSTVTVGANADHYASSIIGAQSTVTAAGSTVSAGGSATIAAAFTMAAGSSVEHNAQATSGGASTTNIVASVEHNAQFSAAATTTFTAGNQVERRAAGTIAGVTTMASDSFVEDRASATIAAVSTLTTPSSVERRGLTSNAATSAISFAGTVIPAGGGGSGAIYYDTIIASGPVSFLQCDDAGGSVYDEGTGAFTGWSASLLSTSEVSLIDDGVRSWGFGVNNYISSYDFLGGGSFVNEYTIEAWYLFEANPDTASFPGDMGLFDMGSFDSGRLTITQDIGFGFEWIFQSNTESVNFGVPIGMDPFDGLPHYVAMTYSANIGQVTLYIDGNFQNNGFVSSPAWESFNGNSWCMANFGSWYIQGKADELAVYDYALDSTTVAAHYAAGIAATGGNANGAATIPGQSADLATAMVIHNATATIAGVSTVVAGSSVEKRVAATINAASTVTSTAMKDAAASLNAAGQSTVTAGAFVEDQAAATIAGTSTVTAGGYAEKNASATINAISTVTSAGVTDDNATATIAGSSTVTAPSSVERRGSMTANGQSTVTASAPTSGQQLGAATINAVSAATASSSAEHNASATIAGVSTVVAGAYAERLSSLTIAATSDGTITGRVEHNASSTMTAGSIVTATGQGGAGGSATIAGISTVVATGDKSSNASATSVATGTVVSGSSVEHRASLVIAAQSGATSTGSMTIGASVVISGQSSVAANAEGEGVFGYTIIRSWSTVKATTGQTRTSVSRPTARSSVMADAMTVNTQAHLKAVGAVTANGTVLSAASRQPRRVFPGRSGIKGSHVQGRVK